MSVQKKQKTSNETTYTNTRFVECESSHIWKINGFLTKCPLESKECLESSKFKVPGCESNFYMKLFPRGEKNDDSVSLFMFVVNGEPSITCKFALVDRSGREVHKQKFTNAKIASYGYGYSTFISRKELQKQKLALLPGDELTVSCVVTMYVEEQCSVYSTCGNTMVDDWASLFDRKEGADVVLKVGSHSIPAHKTVLMCRSPVFCAMFKSDIQEGNTGEVQVSDIDRDVLQALLSFLYTDRVSVSDVEFALKLLLAANRFAVQLLQSICAQYLEENLSADNVFSILLVADACGCKELSNMCVRQIRREMSVTDVVTQLDSSPHLIRVMKKHLSPK